MDACPAPGIRELSRAEATARTLACLTLSSVHRKKVDILHTPVNRQHVDGVLSLYKALILALLGFQRKRNTLLTLTS